ncbi:MAG: type II toxin-antitoxin system RelE/ParE family toxin [Chloroflexota bacterium]
MMTEGEWSIVLYLEASGRSPVQEFLEGLDARTLARFIASTEQLVLRNISAREPLVSHLEGKVWEIREQSGPNTYRLLYFVASRRRIVLLHGFQKKTRKTPRREIEVALRRMGTFIQREGGG